MSQYEKDDILPLIDMLLADFTTGITCEVMACWGYTTIEEIKWFYKTNHNQEITDDQAELVLNQVKKSNYYLPPTL